MGIEVGKKENRSDPRSMLTMNEFLDVRIVMLIKLMSVENFFLCYDVCTMTSAQ